MFRHAIVRPPGRSFPRGLTKAELGPPDVDLAIAQHERYCAALERCGLELTRLRADEEHPDSTFVEDTAVVTAAGAVIARPGSGSRRGEVRAVREALAGLVPVLGEIVEPGTLDGGDVCEADDRFLIGISQRTNPEGAHQLADLLARAGFASSTLDIRSMHGLLHLKSGAAAVGQRRLVAVDALVSSEALRGFELVHVQPDEDYAANCVRVNDHILVASGFPKLEAELTRLGHSVIALDVSEFRKMDGGLSCLSLRF